MRPRKKKGRRSQPGPDAGGVSDSTSAAPVGPPLAPPPTNTLPAAEPVAVAGEHAAAAPNLRAVFDGFVPYEVGDPGRAAYQVVPRLDPEFPAVPDTVFDGVTLAGAAGVDALVLRAASVRGLSHRYAGKVRQDAYAFSSSPGRNFLVVVVADGVSAGRWSHVAATVASQHVCTEVARSVDSVGIDSVDWSSVLAGASQAVVARHAEMAHGSLPKAPAQSFPADDMATTLVAAVVPVDSDESGARRVAVTRVGDASCWVRQAPDSWRSVGSVKNDGADLASSATVALPVAGRPEVQPEFVTVGADDCLLLVTDGIGDPLVNGDGEVGSALAALWAQPPHPVAFAAQVDFARRSFDDDRTVVAIWQAR